MKDLRADLRDLHRSLSQSPSPDGGRSAHGLLVKLIYAARILRSAFQSQYGPMGRSIA